MSIRDMRQRIEALEASTEGGGGCETVWAVAFAVVGVAVAAAIAVSYVMSPTVQSAEVVCINQRGDWVFSGGLMFGRYLCRFSKGGAAQ